MFKEIEIKGLATRRTLIEIDEETVNRLKGIFDADNWEDTYDALNDLLLSDDREEFTHVTRQDLEVQSAEYKVKGGCKKKISATSKTHVEQVKTIGDAYKGKYAVVESMIGQVYELDEISMTEESLSIEVGKFNADGYFERILPKFGIK